MLHITAMLPGVMHCMAAKCKLYILEGAIKYSKATGTEHISAQS